MFFNCCITEKSNVIVVLSNILHPTLGTTNHQVLNPIWKCFKTSISFFPNVQQGATQKDVLGCFRSFRHIVTDRLLLFEYAVSEGQGSSHLVPENQDSDRQNLEDESSKHDLTNQCVTLKVATFIFYIQYYGPVFYIHIHSSTFCNARKMLTSRGERKKKE